MVFGIFKATSGALDWNAVSPGNKIQVFAQILYGYGYWGPFALEYEKSTVDCGTFDLERALAEYSYVTSYQSGNLNPTIATYFTTELNGKIKENLYCLVRIHYIPFKIFDCLAHPNLSVILATDQKCLCISYQS